MLGWLKNAINAAVRLVVRVFATIWGVAVGLPDLVLGFLCWPEKKLRIQVFILSDQTGPVATEADLQAPIDYARNTFKQRFNVKLLPYGSQMVQIIKNPAPGAAMNPHAGFGALLDEYGEPGEFFAQHVAGWNGTPVSGTFPISVFVVADVGGDEYGGCSLGPLTDYVTIDTSAVKASGGEFGSPVTPAHISTLAHEVGHACNLPHWSWDQANLMYPHPDRGNDAHPLQKNLFRSSRHVLYW
jgi:hypothetical protein